MVEGEVHFKLQVKPIEFLTILLHDFWKKYFSDAECILAI